MKVPVGYHGGVVGLWCHCFCPSVYAHKADGPIGTVGFLVWDALNNLQEDPYQCMPHLFVKMPLLGFNGFCFILELLLSIVVQLSCFLFLFQLLGSHSVFFVVFGLLCCCSLSSALRLRVVVWVCSRDVHCPFLFI